MISEDEIKQIEQRAELAQIGPWKAFIEVRDHESGSDFIMTGLGQNFEITGCTDADYDFIANAHQDIPRLIKEIRELKNESE